MILKEIDISKGHEHYHPEIKTGNVVYLVKHNGSYLTGNFSKQWFGLTFHPGFFTLQFDALGFNRSKWEAIWEIID